MDPILASGSSAIAALEVLLKKGVKEENIIFLSLIAAPQGIHRVCTHFPKIQVVTSEIDHTLSERHIVLPGIGEFGDRRARAGGGVGRHGAWRARRGVVSESVSVRRRRYFGTESVSAAQRVTDEEPPV